MKSKISCFLCSIMLITTVSAYASHRVYVGPYAMAGANTLSEIKLDRIKERKDLGVIIGAWVNKGVKNDFYLDAKVTGLMLEYDQNRANISLDMRANIGYQFNPYIGAEIGYRKTGMSQINRLNNTSINSYFPGNLDVGIPFSTILTDGIQLSTKVGAFLTHVPSISSNKKLFSYIPYLEADIHLNVIPYMSLIFSSVITEDYFGVKAGAVICFDF